MASFAVKVQNYFTNIKVANIAGTDSLLQEVLSNPVIEVKQIINLDVVINNQAKQFAIVGVIHKALLVEFAIDQFELVDFVEDSFMEHQVLQVS